MKRLTIFFFILVFFVNLVHVQSMCKADEINTPLTEDVDELVQIIKKQIDDNTQRLLNLEKGALEELREEYIKIRSGITYGSALSEFDANLASKGPQIKRDLRAIYAAKIKSGTEEIVDIAENQWRTFYIQSTSDEKVATLILFEAILDGLASDGYITHGEVLERKARICREWPEARLAYGIED